MSRTFADAIKGTNRANGGGSRPATKKGQFAWNVEAPPRVYPMGADVAQKPKAAKDNERLQSPKTKKRKPTANVNFADFSPTNVLIGKYKIERDIRTVSADRKPLMEVQLKSHGKPNPDAGIAARVYRSAPEKLSSWKLASIRDGRLVPAADLIPYELNTALYSDETSKQRWIRLPDGGQIKWEDEAVLRFPVGTVIAKTFSYPPGEETEDRSGSREQLLETRIQVHKPSGWYGFSYIWNDQQTDAVLSLGGGEKQISWVDESGERRSNLYQIPNANQCLSCHSQEGHFS